MKRSTLIWIITAICLLVAGGIIFTVSLVMVGFDFLKLDNNIYEPVSIGIDTEFSSISVDMSITDLKILPSADGKNSVVCYSSDKTENNVYVKDSVLYIESDTDYNMLDHLVPVFTSPSVTLYLARSSYEFLNVESNTGDITVNTFSFDTLNVKTSTGELTVNGVDCTEFKADTSTGDITLNSVAASGSLRIEGSTADIEFNGCDAAEVYVKTSTGDVEGSFLTGKSFNCKSSTGDIEVPRQTSGGVCEITTSTGDIEIDVLG